MKKLIHKYITFWLIPFYKRKIAGRLKSIYNKYQCWKYGIESHDTLNK